MSDLPTISVIVVSRHRAEALRRAVLALGQSDHPRLELVVVADPALRQFFYMPFEHSESLADQQRSVALFEALGDAGYLDYARRHLDPIARFGRFPHRNRMLGRNTTAEEQAYLDAGGGF